MRLFRLVLALLAVGAAVAFAARLLRPVPALQDEIGDLGYVGPTPSDTLEVSVPDALPLSVPAPRHALDEPVDAG